LGQFTYGKIAEGFTKAATYSGNFRQGRFEGLGRKDFGDGGYYEGNFEQDMFKGQGKLVTKDGWIYAGNFFRGQLNGMGGSLRLPNKQGLYAGTFSQGKFNGVGVYCFPDGSRWHGYFERGVPVGIGEFIPFDSSMIGQIGLKYDPTYQKGLYTELCKGRKLIGGHMETDSENKC